MSVRVKSKDDEPVVEVSNLTKSYRLYPKPIDRAKEWLSLGRLSYAFPKPALQGISFRLNTGECLGVIGRNGSGKSTLLSILAGVRQPTSGKVHVRKQPFALYEIASGFHPRLTGAQNMVSVTRLLGLPPELLEQQREAILDFSELGSDLHRPIREYSTGMKARLAFSLFSHLEPDLLLIDEALSVGDAAFQKKSAKRLRQLIQENHRSVILVSHGLSAIRQICDRALWIDRGVQKAIGPVDEVLERYQQSN